MSKKSARSAYGPSKTDLDHLSVSGSGIITINGWETGYLGNAEYMVFLPSDLILSTITAPFGTPLDQLNHVEVGYSADSGSSKQFPYGPTNGFVGSVVVPPGFRAISAVAYGTPGGGIWKISRCDRDTNTNTLIVGSLGAGAPMNDTASFSTAVEGLQYVTLNYIPNDPTSLFHGAQIFLEKI